MVQIGSWGTPELGITEALSRFFGQGVTSQGGSNLMGDQSQTTLVPSTSGGYAPIGQSGAYGINLGSQASPAGVTPSAIPTSSTSTSGGGNILGQNISAPSQPSGPSAEDILNQGYNDYYSQLDQQLAGLGTQKSAQEQIAQNSFNQGLNTVGNQFSTSQNQLEGNRKKTLADLTDNLMQSFRQGNVMLGTRGASDSSAANQYSYALAKEGNRSRGDVQQQYDQNMFNLKNTYDTEVKNLELQKNSQLQQIAGWFADAQNSLRSQRGQAALQKSQQALSLAMQAADQVRQQIASKVAVLDTWAANNAKSFTELAQNLGRTGQFMTQAPTTFGNVAGVSQANPSLFGYGSTTEDKTRGLFG